MIGILVVTHGHLSEMLLETASMLVSDTSSTRSISFMPGQGVEDLENALESEIKELQSSEGILTLVDLPGGSPARVAASLLIKNPQIEVISGVNLPMLVEVLMMRNQLSLSELMNYAVASGIKGIVNIGKFVKSMS